MIDERLDLEDYLKTHELISRPKYFLGMYVGHELVWVKK